jgi:polyisoprenoid-binding protein YceI
MKKLSLLSAVLLSVSTFALVAAADLESVGNDSTIEFTAVATGGLTITGESKKGDVSEKEDGGKLKFKGSLKNLTTGIGLRDKHLKKYMNVAKHPDTTFEVERSKLQFPADQAKFEGKSATGSLTMNGKTLSQAFTYDVERHGSDYIVTGHMDVDITKYGIEQPCYLGVCVDPVVKVTVKIKLRDKS